MLILRVHPLGGIPSAFVHKNLTSSNHNNVPLIYKLSKCFLLFAGESSTAKTVERSWKVNFFFNISEHHQSSSANHDTTGSMLMLTAFWCIWNIFIHDMTDIQSSWLWPEWTLLALSKKQERPDEPVSQSILCQSWIQRSDYRVCFLTF